MRKFKTCSRRGLPFRLLVIVAGALLLLAAFAPCANADLLRFYDFEGPPSAPYPVGLHSNPPALETGPGVRCDPPKYHQWRSVSRRQCPPPGAPIPLNLPPGALPNTTSLITDRDGVTNLNVIMPFNSATGIYNIHVGQLRVPQRRKWFPICSASDEH